MLKERKKEKGMSVIEILVLVGTLIVLLIGSLYAYKYFTGTYFNTKSIAEIQGATSSQTAADAKIGGLSYGATMLLDGSSSDYTNFESTGQTITRNIAAPSNNRFLLVYANSDYNTGGTVTADKTSDVFVDPTTGDDRVSAGNIPLSKIRVLSPHGVSLSTTAGMKLDTVPGTKTVNFNGTPITYDVYKLIQ
jgi:hypothetical protein